MPVNNNISHRTTPIQQPTGLFGKISQGFSQFISTIPFMPYPRVSATEETAGQNGFDLQNIEEVQPVSCEAVKIDKFLSYEKGNHLPVDVIADKLASHTRITISKEQNRGWLRSIWISVLLQKNPKEIDDLLKQSGNIRKEDRAAIAHIADEFRKSNNLNSILDAEGKLKHETNFYKATKRIFNQINSKAHVTLQKDTTFTIKQLQDAKEEMVSDMHAIRSGSVISNNGLIRLMSFMGANTTLAGTYQDHKETDKSKRIKYNNSVSIGTAIQEPETGNSRTEAKIWSRLKDTPVICQDEYFHPVVLFKKLQNQNPAPTNSLVPQQVTQNQIMRITNTDIQKRNGMEISKSQVNSNEQVSIRLSNKENNSWLRAAWISIATQKTPEELETRIEQALQLNSQKDLLRTTPATSKEFNFIQHQINSNAELREAVVTVMNTIYEATDNRETIDVAKLIENIEVKATLKNEDAFMLLTQALIGKGNPEFNSPSKSDVGDVMALASKSGGIDFIKDLHKKLQCVGKLSKNDGANEQIFLGLQGGDTNDEASTQNFKRVSSITSDDSRNFNIRVSKEFIDTSHIIDDKKFTLSTQEVNSDRQKYILKPKLYLATSNFNNANKNVDSVYLMLVQQGQITKSLRIMGKEKSGDLSYLELPNRLNQLLINQHKENGREFKDEYSFIKTKTQNRKFENYSSSLSDKSDYSVQRSSILSLADTEVEFELEDSFSALELNLSEDDLRTVMQKLDGFEKDENDNINPGAQTDEEKTYNFIYKEDDKEFIDKKKMKELISFISTKSNQDVIGYSFRKNFKTIYGNLGHLKISGSLSKGIEILDNLDDAKVLMEILSLANAFTPAENLSSASHLDSKFIELVESKPYLKSVLEGLIITGRKHFILDEESVERLDTQKEIDIAKRNKQLKNLHTMKLQYHSRYKNQFLKDIHQLLTQVTTAHNEAGNSALLDFDSFKNKTFTEGAENYLLKTIYSNSKKYTSDEIENTLFPEFNQALILNTDQDSIQLMKQSEINTQLNSLLASMRHYYTNDLVKMNHNSSMKIYSILNEALNPSLVDNTVSGASMLYNGTLGYFTRNDVEDKYTQPYIEAAKSLPIASNRDLIAEAKAKDKNFELELETYELDSFKKLQYIDGMELPSLETIMDEFKNLKSFDLSATNLNNIMKGILLQQVANLSPEKIFNLGNKNKEENNAFEINDAFNINEITIQYNDFIDEIQSGKFTPSLQIKNADTETLLINFYDKIKNYIHTINSEINTLRLKKTKNEDLNTIIKKINIQLLNSIKKPTKVEYESMTEFNNQQAIFADFLEKNYSTLTNTQKKKLNKVIQYVFLLNDPENSVTLPTLYVKNSKSDQKPQEFDKIFTKNRIAVSGNDRSSEAKIEQSRKDYKSQTLYLNAVDHRTYSRVNFNSENNSELNHIIQYFLGKS